jgi:hypothetical protein
MFTVSGQVPCSGAQRQDKGLDVVSTAIHGDAVAMNVEFTCILERSGKMSGATICYTFLNVILNCLYMALRVGIFSQFI